MIGPRTVAIRQNNLLSSLSPRDRGLLSSHLDYVEFKQFDYLYEKGGPVEFVFFITAGLTSLAYETDDAKTAELALVGNEGMIGVPIVLGEDQAPYSAQTVVSGAALRMHASMFRQILLDSDPVRRVMLRYVHTLLNQVAQSAACAHFHPLEQRICRWLLMARDRMQSNEFDLTHELLATRMSVRRASVTIAAGALQRQGLIRYKLGRLTIQDAEGIRQRSCECYAVSQREFNGLLGDMSRRRK